MDPAHVQGMGTEGVENPAPHHHTHPPNHLYGGALHNYLQWVY